MMSWFHNQLTNNNVCGSFACLAAPPLGMIARQSVCLHICKTWHVSLAWLTSGVHPLAAGVIPSMDFFCPSYFVITLCAIL